VNISSIDKAEFYPTPEFKNVLAAAESLKAEFSMHWAGQLDKKTHRRFMEGLELLRESLSVHYKELYAREQALAAAASDSYTRKQKALLVWLAENYDGRAVYTALIERLSEDLGIPKSTVRWNLRGLREAGLIRAGDRENKGIPVALTQVGQLMAEYLTAELAYTEHI
jgi:DNA-binding transcriptional ArsR family regulator